MKCSHTVIHGITLAAIMLTLAFVDSRAATPVETPVETEHETVSQQVDERVDLDSAQQTPRMEANWRLLWADEFYTPGQPNPEYWQFEEGFVRNAELQYYTANRPENARVEDGMLVIEARREIFPNGQHRPASTEWQHKREVAQYTSASVTTTKERNIYFGRVDVRAKLPIGRGVWPAIWLRGKDDGHPTWPDCGELDLMEYVGHLPNKVWSAIHTKKYNWTLGNHKKSILEKEDLGDAFHVYSARWSPDRIECFVDGECHFTYAKEGDNTDAWPFDHPFQLILNLAIGGHLGGQQGVDDSIFPQKFLIDYVRVYEAVDQPFEARSGEGRGILN